MVVCRLGGVCLLLAVAFAPLAVAGDAHGGVEDGEGGVEEEATVVGDPDGGGVEDEPVVPAGEYFAGFHVGGGEAEDGDAGVYVGSG